jgi:phage terminase large subunit-like protein
MPPAKTTARTRGSKRAGSRRAAALPPTLGAVVCRWMETNLIHGEGDCYGQSFRLRVWQRALIYRAYELNPDGSRKHRRVLWGFPKGNGKTELAAAVAVAELCGPVVFDSWGPDGAPRGRARVSPDIPVGAASFEQANLLFGAVRAMTKHRRLAPVCDVYDTRVLLKDRPGRLYRIAAMAGTNDGRKPTFFVADEVHEWVGNKERVHLVIENGLAKREDSWCLNISTAGWDSQSLLGKLYAHGKRCREDPALDPEFLMDWFEASSEFDLDDPKQFEAAVRQANPAVEDFLPLAKLLQRRAEIPDYEFRRYHLNQWTSAPEHWFLPGVWESRARPKTVVAPGTRICIGFDGSYSGDSTALVGETMERHAFVIDAWEKPAGSKADWRVDVLAVEQAIREACGTYDVVAVGCDPYRWQRSLAVLQQEGLPVIEWPSHQASHMVPACAQFYEGVANNLLTHDGDERLARHVANCVVKIDGRGPRIAKDHKDSERHIDLAVAAVIADDLVLRQTGAGSWGFASFDMEMR